MDLHILLDPVTNFWKSLKKWFILFIYLFSELKKGGWGSLRQMSMDFHGFFLSN